MRLSRWKILRGPPKDLPTYTATPCHPVCGLSSRGEGRPRARRVVSVYFNTDLVGTLNWPEDRIRPLMETFGSMLMEQRVYRDVFGVI